jgi:hypothetical protein
MIVRIVEEIEKATTIIQDDPTRVTPFSDDPLHENEVIIQHSVWICMGALTGDPYERQDFADHVYDQYTLRAGIGTDVSSEEEKERLDPGIADFWNVFMATGVEAKVIKADQPEPPILIQDRSRATCSMAATLAQIYSRGQNDQDQYIKQAVDAGTGKCMYQTAEMHLTWKLSSECDCNNNTQDCEGKIAVELQFKIARLNSGNPTTYKLIVMPPPAEGKHTHATDRDGTATDNRVSPATNNKISIDAAQRFGEEQFEFEKINDTTFLATGKTTIPCKAGRYAVRFLVSESPGGGLQYSKHRYKRKLTLVADANITIKQDNCSMLPPAIEGFASEFRANFQPKPFVYRSGHRDKTADPAVELPQVRVDGDDEVYYNLLKLVKENGRDVDAPFAKKEPTVRRGE